jgi:hypothetical protein
MVFEPDEAPRDRNAFLDWYWLQTQWSEDHAYNDPAETTERLAAWYAEMRRDFPNMKGPGGRGVDGDHDPRLTDYCIGRSVIHAAFAWSEAESAYAAVRALAVKHGVGFFNVSARDGEVWFPPTDHVPDTTAIPGLALTLEGQQVLNSPSVALIEAAVDWLNPSGGPGFLVLENRNGNYVQAGGGKEACTAEWREYLNTGFGHWVAGMPERDSSRDIRIPGNGTYFSIKENEWLSNESIKVILLAFAGGKSRPKDFVWRDITSKFDGDNPRFAAEP